eukprot:GEMP01006549.1.p1 GENE.GEMP01006549.1~~GEMP01006549.1.p1  ORF type:complete len:855 (+),score=190.57 GEMP01006549.1:454-3018(+)
MDCTVHLAETAALRLRSSPHADPLRTCGRGDNEISSDRQRRGNPAWILDSKADQWNVFWGEQAYRSSEHYNNLVGMCGGEKMDPDSGYTIDHALQEEISSMGQTWKANEKCADQLNVEIVELKCDNDEISRKITEVLRQLDAEKEEWKVRKAHMFRMIQQRTEALASYKPRYSLRAAELKKAHATSKEPPRKGALLMKYSRPPSHHSLAWNFAESPHSGPDYLARPEAIAKSSLRDGNLWQLTRKTRQVHPKIHRTRPTLATIRSRSGLGEKVPDGSPGGLRASPSLRTQTQGDAAVRDTGHFLATHEFDKVMTPRDAIYVVNLVHDYLESPQNRHEGTFVHIRKLLPTIPRLADPNSASATESAEKSAKALEMYHAVVDEEGADVMESLRALIADIAHEAPTLILSTLPPVEHYFVALTCQAEVNAIATTFAGESGGTPIICGPKHFFAVTQCKDDTPGWDFARAGILYPDFITLIEALKALHTHAQMCVRHVVSTFGTPGKHGRSYVQLFITINDSPGYCPFELQLMHRKLCDNNAMDDKKLVNELDEHEPERHNARYAGPLSIASRKNAAWGASPSQKLRISDAMQAWDERTNSPMTASLGSPINSTRKMLPSFGMSPVSGSRSPRAWGTPRSYSSFVSPFPRPRSSESSSDKRKTNAEVRRLPVLMEGRDSHAEPSDVPRLSDVATEPRKSLTSRSETSRKSAQRDNASHTLSSTSIGNQLQPAEDTLSSDQPAKKQSDNAPYARSSTSIGTQLRPTIETDNGGELAKKRSVGGEQDMIWTSFSGQSGADDCRMRDSQISTDTRGRHVLGDTEQFEAHDSKGPSNHYHINVVRADHFEARAVHSEHTDRT